MSLDRYQGEFVAAYGPHHVVPAVKWADTPYWEAAQEFALKVFAKTTIEERMLQRRPFLSPVKFRPDAVLAQEHRCSGRIVFFFHWRYGDKDKYVPVPIALSPQDENQLVIRGRWKRETIQ